MPVLVKCRHCGNMFPTRPCKAYSGDAKYCSRACLAKATICRPEVRGRVGRLLKGRPNWSPGMTGKKHSEETKLRISRSLLGHPDNLDMEQRKRQVEGVRRWLREGGFEKLHRYHPGPNNLELELLRLLSKVFPGEWKYTGDGSFKLGNYIPDFVNCNGKKLIVELFGDYWHGRKGKVRRQVKWDKTEEGRIETYKGFGFRCLVIWEHELEDEKGVISKVKEFVNGQLA